MEVYFTVNMGRKFWDCSLSPLNRGCPLNMVNTGFTVFVKSSAWQMKKKTFSFNFSYLITRRSVIKSARCKVS